MNAVTPHSTPSVGFSNSAAMSALALELAKCLKLVAPVSMDSDAQLAWIASAVDALEDIRADEVKAISAELRRSVTRHNQIVPEIAKLVAEKRARAHRVQAAPASMEWEITRKAQEMRAKAKTQDEIEAAWLWEREARIAAGYHVSPIAPPFNRKEIAALSPSLVKMGLKCGALIDRDGEIVNA